MKGNTVQGISVAVDVSEPEVAVLDSAASGTHTHWWQIQPPAGVMSLGRCKFCKATRQFDNREPVLMYTGGKRIKK